MATTDIYALPAPDHPQEADGPEQILNLAKAIEALLTTGVLKMAGGKIEVADPTAAQHPVTLKYWQDRIRIGPAANAPAAGALPDGSIWMGT